MSEPTATVPPTPEPPDPPRVRIWPRLAVAAVVLVVGLILAGFLGTYRAGQRAAEERAALEADLDANDPNWRLADLEKAREEIPDHENSARVVVSVVGLLPRNWPESEFHTLLYTFGSTHRLTPAQAARLEAELGGMGAALEQADRLADMPRGRHRLTWAHNPIATLMPDQQSVRQVGSLLDYEARRRTQNGDIDGALRCCRCAINAARSLGDEPLMISVLIRCAVLFIAGNAAERALAQGVASEKELARLQQLLALENQHQTMRIALRGERASSYDLLGKMADGRISTDEMEVVIDGQRTEWWQRLARPGMGRNEPTVCLRLMTKQVDSTKLPEGEQMLAEQEYEREARSLRRDAPYASMLLPAVVKVGRTVRRKTALIRCLLVLVAVERYRLANGRWPERLDELKPRWLAEVPADPFDGKPLRYKELADGVMVYSVGEDGSDDGGNVDRTRPQDKGVDQGYRLWDAARRSGSPQEELPPPVVEKDER